MTFFVLVSVFNLYMIASKLYKNYDAIGDYLKKNVDIHTKKGAVIVFVGLFVCITVPPFSIILAACLLWSAAVDYFLKG